MGAFISAPMSCAASCCGGLLAGCCCKLAMSGSTSTTRSARCVLLWLQAFAAAVACLMTINPSSWLQFPCDHLDGWGVCECYGKADEDSCLGDQLIYRAEASVAMVYCFLLILCVSGCATAAATSFPVGKFLAVVVLLIVLLFLPNSLLSVFGGAAGVISSAYLVAQTVVLVDFAYDWNSTWHTNALQALRREISSQRGYRMWLVAIVASSVLLLIGGLVGCILLCIDFPVGGARALVITTFIVSLVLLVVSISEWCEHGALLTSTVVVAYSMWLSYEALSMLSPGDDFTPKLLPRWVGLTICTLSLTAFSFSSGLSGSGKTKESPDNNQALVAAQAEAGRAGDATTAAAAADTQEARDVVPGIDVWEFTVQCAVHLTASLYIASSLAPTRSTVTFAVRVAAVCVSVLLYGWTLVAPKVLSNRSFS